MTNNPATADHLIIVKDLIKKDLDCYLNDQTFEALKKELAQFLQHLINTNFERLLIGLYRIDVSEKKVKEILTLESPDLIYERLAELIIDRQLQKASWRMKYSKKAG